MAVERADVKDISNGRFLVKLIPETKDEIEIDNTYFFNFSFNTGRVLLVGQTQGEQYLEDPNKQLDISFKVNGYAVERKDQFSSIQGSKVLDDYNIVATQFSGSRYDFCPSGDVSKLEYDIWMIPEMIEKNAKSMCVCLGKIFKKSVSCENTFDRKSFVNTLQDLNFDPIGGAMGDYMSAPFFRYDNGSSYILVSTISLNPRVEGGIKHGKLPILVSDLIKLSSRTTLEDFEYGRVVYSISKFLGDNLDPGQENLKSLSYANVPKGESSFIVSSKIDQLANANGDKDIAGVETSRLEKSSKNIVALIFQVICIVFILEIIFYLAKFLIKRKSKHTNRRSDALSIFLSVIFFGGLIHDSSAFGYHRIDVLNTSYGSFNKLLKDVENRTSIDADKPSQRVVSLSKNLSSSYWIWTKGSQSILGVDRKMNENLALWIKKGGLLVLQGNFSKYQLDLLTSQFFVSEGKTGEWKIITPDHEIMRSFYLIDSLPSCDDNPWFEFRYDGRMSILVIPDDFLNYVTDRSSRTSSCKGYKSREKLLRTFINVSMVALTTDYKKIKYISQRFSKDYGEVFISMIAFGKIEIFISILSILGIVWIFNYGIKRGLIATMARGIWVGCIFSIFFPDTTVTQIPSKTSLKKISILLDDSASMSKSRGLSSNLKEAESYIDSFKNECEKQGCSISVTNLSDVSKQVAQGSTPLLEAAENFVEGSSGSPWVIISDGGDKHPYKTNLYRSDLDQVKQRPGLVVGVGIGDEPNVWVSDLDIPSFGFAGKPTEIAVKVSRDTARAVTNNIQIQADVDGNSVQYENVRFRENELSKIVSMTLPPSDKGHHLISVKSIQVDGEVSTWDNLQSAHIEIIPNTIGILHISGSPSADTRYLRRFVKSEPKFDLISFFILRDPWDSQVVSEREMSLIPFQLKDFSHKNLLTLSS